MTKKLISSILTFTILFCLLGCETDKNDMKDSEIYKVSLSYENEVAYNTPFTICVVSENVSGRDIHSITCSSLYKIGATIKVYAVIDGKEYVLRDEFETVTEDRRTEVIKAGETLTHNWKFDGTLNLAVHGTIPVEGIPQRLVAPKGSYSILVSTGELIENAFTIV